MGLDDTGQSAATGDLRPRGTSHFAGHMGGLYAALVTIDECPPVSRGEALRALGPTRRRLPATGTMGACALCLALVAVREPGAHLQEHIDPSGAAVRLLWCRQCAETDPWLQALADNENAPAGCPAAARRFEDLHRELHARVLAQGGADALRAVIHVARDLPPPNTLRGAGASWGLPTKRGL